MVLICLALTQVYDQHLDFIVLEPSLFSLSSSLHLPIASSSSTKALPSTSPAPGSSPERSTYELLNDPKAGEADIEEVVERVAKGLFSVVATMGASPSAASGRWLPDDPALPGAHRAAPDHPVSPR